MILATALAAAWPVAALDSFRFLTPGAPQDLRDRLYGSSLLTGLTGDGVEDPQELLAAARAEYSRLLGTLYASGYYGGIVRITIDGREAAEIPPLATLSELRSLQVEVEPGPRYAFSRATVTPLAEGTDLPEGYAAGQPARTTVIRNAAEAAVGGWRNVGHAKARVAGQSIVADHGTRSVASDLRIDPGPRLRFGELRIEGANRVRVERVREIAGLPEGQVFDPEEIDKSVTRLRRAGVFRSVSLTEAETANADGTLDMTLQLAEERRRRYGVGLEYSTVDGFSASAYWMHRNLFGGAERLRVEGEWSSIDGGTGGMDYALGARLTRPATRGPDTDLYIDLQLEQFNEPDYTSHSVAGEIGYTRIASDRLSVGVGVGFRVSSINDATGTEEYRFLTLPLKATWDDRDDSLNATRGLYADAQLTPLVGLSGSETAARFFIDGRAYRTFNAARPVTLAGRLQFGSIVSDTITGVPSDLRFYSGGGGTVRGQEYQSLDIDLGTVRSGGRSFVGLSAEARVGVTNSIGLVAFADWGYVGRNSLPDDTGGSHAGAGVGVRYNTGIGPLRLDLATPVSGDTGGDKLHIYIGIGQAF